ADPPRQRAVVAPLRPGFLVVAAGDLLQAAVAQVAHEQVAVAHEGHPRAGGVVDRAGRVEGGALAVRDQARRAGAVHRHLPGVADAGAVALALVLRRGAVPGPPVVLHAVPDP